MRASERKRVELECNILVFVHRPPTHNAVPDDKCEVQRIDFGCSSSSSSRSTHNYCMASQHRHRVMITWFEWNLALIEFNYHLLKWINFFLLHFQTPSVKPTKYHFYPHNQHIYLLPECAIQQVIIIYAPFRLGHIRFFNLNLLIQMVMCARPQ